MSDQNIPVRKLGRDGPTVAALGFGLMGMSHDTYGSVPDDEARFKLLDRAYEIGARHWDSADLYGDSEELLGKWFRRSGKRNDIFLATKFGLVKGSKTFEVDSSAEYCRKACAESLRLLGTDYIDLYYIHHVNAQTPIEVTMRALAELQSEGKIKHIGISSASSDTLRRAIKIAPVAAVQVDYSAFMRDIEGPSGTNLLATCRELGVAVVAAMPLGRGLLTSTFADGKALGDGADKRSNIIPRFMGDNKDVNSKTARGFRELARKKGCTTSQLAIAWLLKQGDDVIPIPGTKQMKYLEENWASLNVELSDSEEAEIRQFVETTEIAGGVVPPMFLKYLFTETVEE